MKSKTKKTGFSIIELLTVMSIIMILLGILVPSLGAVRRYARVVKQKGMFHDMGKGLEMFSVDHDGYTDSSPEDLDKNEYCGAMKVCEAMVGQDGLGFHPDSVFDDKGQAGGVDLYYNRTALVGPPYAAADEQNLRTRKPKYMEGKDIQVASVEALFGATTGTFDPCCPVLCDVFKRTQLIVNGQKAGMPILYYKADPSKLTHDILRIGPDPLSGENIYNYWDNRELVKIRPPWAPTTDHPLYNPPGGTYEGEVFYAITKNKDVTTTPKPYNENSYILISAGWDGLYGTEDDVFNFED